MPTTTSKAGHYQKNDFYRAMNNASDRETAVACYHMIDAMQHKPPAEQTAACAVMFLEMCRIHKAEPIDALRTAGNMMEYAGELRKQFGYVRTYLENVVKGKV